MKPAGTSIYTFIAMGTEIMDKTRKRNIGIMSFIPLVLLITTLAYQASTFSKALAQNGISDQIAMVNGTNNHFVPISILYALTGVASLSMLLYYIVHLLRVKNITVGNKAVWVVFLSVLMPLAFPVFWYLFIMREPERLPINDTIE